ncbi:MAG TPA: hypothetical protein VFE18_11085 [Phenylobacterium sp.]|jgi:hypothetical protein|nr:hypothetical protein [Phenylobacterium sp.]HZZ68705.1 hypothetical protein [Phenylobacterium sp.]
MKAAIAALTLVVALTATAVQAEPGHHHHRMVCHMHHHHRVCHRA